MIFLFKNAIASFQVTGHQQCRRVIGALISVQIKFHFSKQDNRPNRHIAYV